MIYINHIAFITLSLLYYILFQNGILSYKEVVDLMITSGALAFINTLGNLAWNYLEIKKSIKNQIGFSMLFTGIFLLLFVVLYMNSTQIGRAFPLLLLFNFIVFKAALLVNMLYAKN